MIDLPYSLNSNDPSEEDAYAQIKKEVMLDLLSHHVGVIQSYDPDTQTAKIKIAYKRSRSLQDQTGIVTQELIPYPILPEVPLMFMRGGAGSLRFSVEEDDECLLMFVDRDIDYWYTTGNSDSGCNTLRMHALSDAIGVVGLGSTQNLLPPLKATEGLSEDRASLGYGSREPGSLDADDLDSECFAEESQSGARFQKSFMTAGLKNTIKNEEKNLRVILQTLTDKLTDLNQYINDLITATALITVPYASPGGPAVSGPPQNQSDILAVSSDIASVTSALSTIGTDLGDLLT